MLVDWGWCHTGEKLKMCVDTGLVIVVFISMMYLAIVFVMLFYVGNEWCDLLYKNMTVSNPLYNFQKVIMMSGNEV